MKGFKRRVVATIASALVVSSLAGPISASANDSFIPRDNNSLSGQSVIVPYMGNERLIVNGSLKVSSSYDFGYFTLNNNSVKVVWSPNSGSNNFKLQVVQTNWLGDDYVIATMNLGSSSKTDYFTNLPVGKDLHFKVVGKANGDISAYDWGPNN
ncbi:MAG: hypothetical protein E7L01_24090 [Paenibacillus macerans]|uniref:hypothetical protein n=1 Tax=Paenibacillus TaxID=44249 RepID=UPI00290FE2D0|nr:hypothetical protein [Paenibacillus macerans]MDU7476394.1 hypothetical protein [Paenibacillus macerans]